ncbi:hypothetical protein HRI96_09015 [Treponema parvum]|uniref:Uncharacterized protein n=1 Tax=Treponema parvum TaxID=138851 RepID=A0A975F1F8_9SPIR|nr:hypothetical protein [Treponema parvum]QTQ12324.1 hypothetical protein HRI96_09015 [Treponema parvum]
MKNYNKIMDDFLLLDKNERIPLHLTLRLLFCKKCRTEIRLMTMAEKLMQGPVKIQVPVTDESIEKVLKQIDPVFSAENIEKSPISLSRWIAAGIVMTLLMICFGIMTRSDSYKMLVLPFYLLFAGMITVYCAFFVGCNMDFFVKKIETLRVAG